LQNKVKIIVGTAAEILPTLKEKFKIDYVDFVFIDHWKDQYLPDLKRLEENKLLKNGAVLVADNVLFPGAPDYLDYIQKNPKYTTTQHKATLEYSTIEDAVEVSIYKGD